MRDKDIDVAYLVVLEKLDAKRSQSRASIKNEHTLTAANLDAWGIAAIANCCWARTGDASSDSPKPNPHRGFQHSACLKINTASFISNKWQCRAGT
jgi:hypothetical protein